MSKHLNAGIYFIKLISDKYISAKRIMKLEN